MYALPKLRILIFSNCQGQGISIFLAPVLRQFFDVETLHLENFEEDRRISLSPADEAFVQSADLCLYQPVHSFDHVDGLFRPLHDRLPPRVQFITFPYIYTGALWPLYQEGNRIKTADGLLDLIREGVTAEALLALYARNRLDFDYAGRYEASARILRAKEAGCDVRIQDFIDANLRDRRLFLTQNHPTSCVFIECTMQICAILAERLGIGALRGVTPALFGNVPANATNLPTYWPIARSALAHYGFRYAQEPDAEADKLYGLLLRQLVTRTLAERSPVPPASASRIGRR